ncbi:MAG: nucleotidyltransferase family protein [Candidatus Asgardarchaeia archaeon]
MFTKGDVLKIISDNWNEIKKFGVKKLWVFGSYIRGEQKEKSDLDVLVEFEKGRKTFDNYMGLKFFLEEILGIEVDLITVKALKPSIKDHVWKEAVPVERL